MVTIAQKNGIKGEKQRKLMKKWKELVTKRFLLAQLEDQIFKTSIIFAF